MIFPLSEFDNSSGWFVNEIWVAIPPEGSNFVLVGYDNDWRKVRLRRAGVVRCLSFPGDAMNPTPVRLFPRSSHAAVLFLASVILAAGPQVPQTLYAQGGARVSGAAISKVARDTRKLTVSAQASAGSTSASGTMQFIHNSPTGLSRFRGTVTCMSVSGGTVQISGVIERGETATGGLLDGKSYAFTLNVGSGSQSFSLPNVGDGIGACSGGRAESVPVTEDGFKLQ